MYIARLMEDVGVDTTVIGSRQHKMGQMANFSPLLASSVFDLKFRYSEKTTKVCHIFHFYLTLLSSVYGTVQNSLTVYDALIKCSVLLCVLQVQKINLAIDMKLYTGRYTK